MGEAGAALWFCGVIAALAGAVRRRAAGADPGRRAGALAGARRRVGAAVAMTVLANIALYRHDAQFDLTRERAFTPSPEARQIVQALTQPVQLTFFYQKQDPAGRDAAAKLRLLARLNPLLEVEAVDSDQHPALANRMGVQVYNTAVVRAGERRIEVVSTDEQEIALAILRAVRGRDKTVCFATGHGEYDIDNFAFHTHFEGAQGHSHNAEGMAVVQMQQHGLGRLRQMLEKLGLVARKVPLAGGSQCRRTAPRWSRPTRAPAIPGPTPRSCAPTSSAAAACCCWSSRTIRSTRTWPPCWPLPACASATASRSIRRSITSPTSR